MAVPFGFLLALVAWPLIAVLSRSLTGVGPTEVLALATRPDILRLVRFTVLQALASAVLTLVVGLPVSHLLARRSFAGRAVLAAVVVVPFVLPTVVVAAAVRAAFEAVGLDPEPVGGLPLPVLAAHVFFNLAVVVRLVGTQWARLDYRRVEVAATLGASPLRAWWTVTRHQLAPAVIAAALLVFMFCFTSYGVIRVLGGLRTATVETEIHRYAVARGKFDVAAVLALIQIMVVAATAAATSRLQRRASVRQDRAGNPRPVRTVRDRVEMVGVVAVVALVIGAPAFTLVEQSLRVGDGYGLAHYRGLGTKVDLLPTTALSALGTSVAIAAVAAAVAVLVGLLAGWPIARGGVVGRAMELLALLPLGVSPVTLGFGYLVGLSFYELRTWTGLVPLAHAAIGLPFVLAALVPALRSVDGRVRDAAATLGASPSVVRRTVEWPLVRGAVAVGGAFAAAVSLGEFGATSFLGRSDGSFTAPLAIFRLLSSPGQQVRGQALALSVIVALMVAVPAAASELARGRSRRRPRRLHRLRGRVGLLPQDTSGVQP